MLVRWNTAESQRVIYWLTITYINQTQRRRGASRRQTGREMDSSCDSGTSTLETNYSNFIARQLYAQKCRKYRNIQYWHAGRRGTTRKPVYTARAAASELTAVTSSAYLHNQHPSLGGPHERPAP